MNPDALRDGDSFRPPQWLRWLAVAVVAGGIFYASLLDSPSTGLPAWGPLGLLRIDKWLHAVAYAALAAALAVALAPGRGLGRSTGRVAVLALTVAVAYGVGIEFAQAPLPERYFSVADMAANATGAVSGVLSWRIGTETVRRWASLSGFET